MTALYNVFVRVCRVRCAQKEKRSRFCLSHTATNATTPAHRPHPAPQQGSQEKNALDEAICRLLGRQSVQARAQARENGVAILSPGLHLVDNRVGVLRMMHVFAVVYFC